MRSFRKDYYSKKINDVKKIVEKDYCDDCKKLNHAKYTKVYNFNNKKLCLFHLKIEKAFAV